MGVDRGLLDLAIAVDVFKPSLEDDVDRYFPAAMKYMVFAYGFAFVACGVMAGVLIHDGWI